MIDVRELYSPISLPFSPRHRTDVGLREDRRATLGLPARHSMRYPFLDTHFRGTHRPTEIDQPTIQRRNDLAERNDGRSADSHRSGELAAGKPHVREETLGKGD